jgi:hypothetical protein
MSLMVNASFFFAVGVLVVNMVGAGANSEGLAKDTASVMGEETLRLAEVIGLDARRRSR